MLRMNFRTADPSRRIPTYLQANTKENIVWQLKLTGLLFVYILGRGVYDEWQWRRKLKKYKNVRVFE